MATVLSPDPTDFFANPKVYPPATQGIQKGLGHWMALGFAGSCLTSTAALAAYASLIQVPQADLDCKTPAALVSGRQRFSCAQQIASSGALGDVVAALQLTRHWSTHHPLYGEAQPLLSRWSETVLRSAQYKYARHGEAEARWLVAQIPPHSPEYDTARQLLHDWRHNYYRQGMVLYGQAQRALKAQDWVGAIRVFNVLEALEGEHPELDLARTLSKQIQAERHAQHQLSTGIQLASQNSIAGQEAAVNHLSQIEHHTYAWQAAQPLLNDWSDRLLDRALTHWYDGELNTAIHLGEQVVLNPERTQAAQDLIWLSQSRQMVLKSVATGPTTLAQTVGLYPALLVARQISPDSPFYPQAAAVIPTWQSRLQNTAQPAVAVAPPPAQPTVTATPHPPQTRVDHSGFRSESFTPTHQPQPGFNPEPFVAPRRSL